MNGDKNITLTMAEVGFLIDMFMSALDFDKEIAEFETDDIELRNHCRACVALEESILHKLDVVFVPGENATA